MVTSDLWMAFLCRTSERPPRLSSREKFAKSSGVILRIEREREERERERERERHRPSQSGTTSSSKILINQLT